MLTDYCTGKSLSKQFQLQFPAYHKKLVKTNKNNNNNIIIIGVISKLIGVKFRKWPGNVNYSRSPGVNQIK